MLCRKPFVLTLVVSLMTVAWAGAQSVARPTNQRPAAIETSPQPSAPTDSASTQPQLATSAQTGADAQASVPRLIRFSGALQNLSGRAISGPADVTFALYTEEAGGAPLWFETQTVQADALGHYSALLGAMSPAGVPVELFTEGQARWLGVMVRGLPEQSRVLLVSVPYALKAGDAETLGGRPAADYQLTPDSTATSDTTTRQGTTTTRGGKKTTNKTSSPTPQVLTATQNYIPVMTANDGSLGNSVMYQTGGFIGVGTTAPAFPFDLNNNVFAIGPKSSRPGAGGTMRFRDDSGTVRWLFGVPGTAGSQDFFMYNYANGHAPIYIQNGAASYSLYLNGNGNVGIGTTTPNAKLEISGPAGVGETELLRLSRAGATYTTVAEYYTDATHYGLDINSGLLVVNNGSASVGIGTSTPAAKLDVVGNVNIPQTASANTGVLLMGGQPFMHSCCAFGSANVMVGHGAGNFTLSGINNTVVGHIAMPNITTGRDNAAVGTATLLNDSSGSYNVATGSQALYTNTTGGFNTAGGAFAMWQNTTGSENTALGEDAMGGNTTGSVNTAAGWIALGVNDTAKWNVAFGACALGNTYGTASTGATCSNPTSGAGNSNTGVGTNAGVSNTVGQSNTFLGVRADVSVNNLTNATAIGANASVGQSNTVVLGSINGVNGASSNVKVGIGTATPISQLQVATGDIVVGPLTALPYSNTNGLYVNNDSGDPNNTFRIDAYANDLAIAGYSGGGAAMGTTITFRTGGPAGGEGNRVRINSSGYVGIGTMGPAYPLDVVGDIHTSGCVMYNGGAVGSCATPSDARLKMNIQPFAPVLDRLVALRPVHYEWNPSNPQKYRYAPGRNPGLIAQEVEAVFPSMVTTGEDGYKKVYYNELPYLLLAGVRELKARNDELKAKVSTLETQNRELTRDVARLRNERSEIAALEARLARLEAISVAGPRQERRAAQKSRPARQRASTEVARVRF